MQISNVATKRKALKLEVSEDFLVHLVLNSLPAEYSHFRVRYNTQKDKWSLNELISHCVQEEERMQREKTESVHMASTSKSVKRKRVNNAAESSKQKKEKKQDSGPACFFCKKTGHMKKQCAKYTAWLLKKGLHLKPTAK